MKIGVKVRKVGNSLGITLPQNLLAKLGVGEGDILYPVNTPEGVVLTRFDPEFAEALDASKDFMSRYPNAMKKLAEG
ncbi:MAG: AbrB/MazE/SpoVT family DNA-binding domain-containing protein [Rhodospirillales bacterium]|nr:AbrB/MazE/SpoVT family DNA-binding domain-containing protein [Rhodospirillales bacterium]